MRRDVSTHLVLDVTTSARLVLEVAAAHAAADDEELVIRSEGRAVTPREVRDAHGTRLHVLDAGPGELDVSYRACVTDAGLPAGPRDAAQDDADALLYLRPSRYCESDVLAPTARAQFAGLAGADLLGAVASWVGTQLAYVPGSSLPTDGAVRTLLARRGVCRDFAHLVVALLRALDVPARVASAYAPGLDPMDLHAVAEALVDGRWCVVDATTLAPRGSLVRIATGRDASDTAFLSVHRGVATLRTLEVAAVADALPDDDVRDLVTLA